MTASGWPGRNDVHRIEISQNIVRQTESRFLQIRLVSEEPDSLTRLKNHNYGPISIEGDEQADFERRRHIRRQPAEKVSMIIKEREAQGVPVLILSGKLDLFAKNALNEVIQKHKENNTKRVLIDMKCVSFIDSAGLGALALAVKKFQQVKGNLILLNPQDMVKGILQNANFSSILPMFRTNDDYSEFSAVS